MQGTMWHTVDAVPSVEFNPVALVAKVFAHMSRAEDRETWLGVMGFTYAGCGSFKTTYANTEWGIVVKLIHNASGANEVHNYETAPEEARPHLLPILCHGKGYQVQQYVLAHGCPPTCRGWIQGMHDSDTRNHTHLSDGTLVIWDYGQQNQWDGEEFVAEVDPDEVCREESDWPMPESTPESTPTTPDPEPGTPEECSDLREPVRIRIINAPDAN